MVSEDRSWKDSLIYNQMNRQSKLVVFETRAIGLVHRILSLVLLHLSGDDFILVQPKLCT